jgi:hypothetical protein
LEPTHGSVTSGTLGQEFASYDSITIQLVKPQDSSGTTTMTVSNFHGFTL